MSASAPQRPAEESALVVRVEEAEALVAATRERFDRSAIRGMPAHVTLLYPFRHPDLFDADTRGALRAYFAGHAPFRFQLAGLCGFPGVLYLVPLPLEPFDALARGLAERFPDTPPYGGAIADPVPHLTVAQEPPAESLAQVSDGLLARLEGALPIPCEARAGSLAVKRAGRWSLAEQFPLGGA
jgi:2'-5' RNA ligase